MTGTANVSLVGLELTLALTDNAREGEIRAHKGPSHGEGNRDRGAEMDISEDVSLGPKTRRRRRGNGGEDDNY